MGLTVVDASVAIAYGDPGDALYDVSGPAIDQRLAGGLVLPASALAEYLVRSVVDGRLDERLADIRLAFTVEPVNEPIAVEAARVRARTRLRLPDALVVATGIVLDADEILTCDDRWRDADRRVVVLRATR